MGVELYQIGFDIFRGLFEMHWVSRSGDIELTAHLYEKYGLNIDMVNHNKRNGLQYVTDCAKTYLYNLSKGAHFRVILQNKSLFVRDDD